MSELNALAANGVVRPLLNRTLALNPHFLRFERRFKVSQ
jgi:hypothetical protein